MKFFLARWCLKLFLWVIVQLPSQLFLSFSFSFLLGGGNQTVGSTCQRWDGPSGLIRGKGAYISSWDGMVVPQVPCMSVVMCKGTISAEAYPGVLEDMKVMSLSATSVLSAGQWQTLFLQQPDFIKSVCIVECQHQLFIYNILAMLQFSFFLSSTDTCRPVQGTSAIQLPSWCWC